MQLPHNNRRHSDGFSVAASPHFRENKSVPFFSRMDWIKAEAMANSCAGVLYSISRFCGLCKDRCQIDVFGQVVGADQERNSMNKQRDSQ